MEKVDLLLGQQAAGLGRAARGLAGVVGEHEFDLRAAHALMPPSALMRSIT